MPSPAGASPVEAAQAPHLTASSTMSAGEGGRGPSPSPPPATSAQAAQAAPPLPAVSAYQQLLRERAPFPWRRGNVIGNGSYGAVWLGMNCLDGSLLAVKEMGLRAQDPTVCAALAQEIATLR